MVKAPVRGRVGRSSTVLPLAGPGGQRVASVLQSLPSGPPGGIMRTRVIPSILAVASLTLLGCDRVSTAPERPGRPSFITNGTVDGTDHPAVVLLVWEGKGTPRSRCSATLIARKVVPTAGHSAGAPGRSGGSRTSTES